MTAPDEAYFVTGGEYFVRRARYENYYAFVVVWQRGGTERLIQSYSTEFDAKEVATFLNGKRKYQV